MEGRTLLTVDEATVLREANAALENAGRRRYHGQPMREPARVIVSAVQLVNEWRHHEGGISRSTRSVRRGGPPRRVGGGLGGRATKAAGVCGTELHILDGMIEAPHLPFVLGHEAAGVVVSAPAGSGVSVGDRVAVYNMIGCGKCQWCRSGNEQVCIDPVGQLGFTLDGTFRDLIAVPAENLIPLPEQVSFADAALLSCGGMTAVHAIRLGNVGLGDTVVVNGVGGVGLMAIQVAYAAGARVLAIADSADKANSRPPQERSTRLSSTMGATRPFRRR